MRDAAGLKEIVIRIVDTRRDQPKISPAWIATEAMRQLHAMTLQRTMPLVYLGCHLQLRQVAREVCRELFEPQTDADERAAEHPLFPGLQWRYPSVRKADEEPQYALLETLSDADVVYNIARLRAEAQSRLKHADALKAWWNNRRPPAHGRGLFA